MSHPRTPILGPGQAETVLAALDDAAQARRERAAAGCGDCARHPAGLCGGHAADLGRADEYDGLSGWLYCQLSAPSPLTRQLTR